MMCGSWSTYVHRQAIKGAHDRDQWSRNGPPGIAGDLQRTESFEQGLEHDADLSPGQRGTEAVVGATASEGDVIVRRSPHVKGEWIVEDILVPVGGGMPERDQVT